LQDICLLHISDNVTVVTGSYNIENGFDSLRYECSSASNHYTGTGIIAANSNYFTLFCWNSDATNPTKSISIQLASMLSTLPYRRSIARQSSFSPILLGDEMTSGSPSPGDAGGEGGVLSGAAIAGIAVSCVVGVGLMATGCVVIAKCASGGAAFGRKALGEAFRLDDQSDSHDLDEKRVALQILRNRERS
jgi:hypothetical protein